MELSPKNVSVVIPTTNKRKQEIEALKWTLTGLGFSDIIIYQDDGNKLYNRYFGAMRAKHEWIYTQDDDCVVNNIPELLKKADIGKIVSNIKEKQYNFYKKSENSGGKVTLIGWGAIFHKSCLGVIDDYLRYNDPDELFCREFDRVLTWFNNKEVIVTDKIADFASAANEKQSMSLEERHWEDLHKIIKRIKQYEKESSVH